MSEVSLSWVIGSILNFSRIFRILLIIITSLVCLSKVLGSTGNISPNFTGKGRSKGGGGGKAQRKRTNKVSYREMESTENDSDEDDIKKTPKKRKKMSSESD